MVKPRKCRRSDSNAGVDSRKSKKFSVYDFNPDDERVEKDSHKMLSKFKPRSPKFSTIDKYNFLRYFMEGAKPHQNDMQKEPLEIEDSDDDVQESVCGLVPPILLSPVPKHELSFANPPIDYPNSMCSFPGARSCIPVCINRGGRDSSQILANDEMFNVDSDDDQENKNCLQNEHLSLDSYDDCVVELRSSSPSELDRHKGSSEEGSEHCSSAPVDSEAVVVVHPDFITLRDMYSTSALLTFSCEYIKLEGSNCLGTNWFSLVWSISDIVKIKSFWGRKVETAFIILLLKSQGEEAARTLDNVSGITELRFGVYDPHWCKRQEAIESLNTRYKATWETVARIDPLWSEFSPLQQKSGTFPEVCPPNCRTAFEKIVYPREDPDAVAVSMKDIELLRPASFINDTIIDFYIKYLELQIKPEEKHRFHFFNSFFFTKLADLDKDLSTACAGRSAFHRVFRWTRKVDLFEKDYLFIPVNFSLHWSLIVVCHPGEVVKSTEEVMYESPKVPCILHLDSIRGSHRGLNKLFQRYLWEEWKERHDKPLEHDSSKFLNLLFITPELPQQENSYDCGLFVLYYVERFLQQAPVHFNPFTTASFLSKDWFLPAEASSRRDHIKNVVYRIANSSNHEDPLTTDDNYSSCYTTERHTGNTCCGRDVSGSNYSAQNNFEEIQMTSSRTVRIGRLGSSQEPNLVAGALRPGDTSRSLVCETCQPFGQTIPVTQLCNTMSPIEEEEATGDEALVMSTVKAGNDIADAKISRRRLPEIEDVESCSESSTGMSPISLEVQGEEDCVPNVLLVSVSEESPKNESSSLSSGELGVYVVEDSFEQNGSPGTKENQTMASCRAKDDEIHDQEVESPYVKANPLEWMASESEEGEMVKPKRLINQKGNLARYLSKDLRL